MDNTQDLLTELLDCYYPTVLANYVEAGDWDDVEAFVPSCCGEEGMYDRCNQQWVAVQRIVAFIGRAKAV